MQGPYGHSLLVTDAERPCGWATGSLSTEGSSIHLHDVDAPIAAPESSGDFGIQIFFSGEAEGAIPWGVGGWESLRKRVVDAGGDRLLLRPHHRHVLTDAPACRHWLFSTEPDPPPCGLALSPTSILVPSMVNACGDHFGRLFEFVGQSCQAVILEDFNLTDAGDIQCVPMGSGLLDGGLMGSLIRAHVPSEVPVIIHAGCVEEANSWLWPGSKH